MNYIDTAVFAKLRQLRILPSALCSDEEFIRRATLDLLGLPPTAKEAKDFVRDTSPNKRDQLVEHLLQREEYADHWALKWGDTLRNEEKSLDPRGVQHFHRWIRDRMAANQPIDAFVHDILTAQGSTYEHPEANFYRAVRDPLGRAEAVAQVFLGTRLQCAKCHNHPFERWTQADYYEWAGNFARVKYRVLENHRRDELDKNEFNGEQVVWMSDEGSVTNPKTGRTAAPRFLGASAAAGGEDPLKSLADWLTSGSNPFFARVQANRIWAHLLGRGIVDPVDDLRATNPGSNPALLDALAQDFVAHGFDQRRLIRTIMASRTYQLSSEPNPTNADDDTNFSHGILRRLSAEQLLDAAFQITGVPPHFQGQPPGMRAGQIPGGRTNPRYGEEAGDRFLAVFGKPERQLACDCERSAETTMGQAFQLLSGPTLNELLSTPGNRIGQWLKDSTPVETLIDQLYWSTLNRAPAKPELEHAQGLIAAAKDKRAALEDLTWALLNAKEFLFRH